MTRKSSAAIFLGAFVLFELEPLVGRTLQSWFGGSASVWITCLACYQMLFVAGYFYADRLSLRPAGLKVHLALLAVAVLWLAFAGLFHGRIASHFASSGPVWIGSLLSVIALGGVPFLVLGANSTLVQLLSGGNYRLYAVSNLGSLIGLFAYPVVVEPFVPISVQWILLSLLSLFYLVLLWNLSREPRSAGVPVVRPQGAGVVAGRWKALWFVIPAVTCFFLNAVTSHLTNNVASVPLIWALLLGGYLASYIIGFGGRGGPFDRVSLVVGLAAVVLATFTMSSASYDTEAFVKNLCIFLVLLVVGVGGLHRWLYRLRPEAELLGSFNLAIAVGGAAGGLLSSFAMPLVSNYPIEYPISLSVIGILFVMGLGELIASVRKYAVASVLAILGLIWYGNARMRTDVVSEGRSFYGSWRVSAGNNISADKSVHPCWVFTHNGTLHGIRAKEATFASMPTAYYSGQGGGVAFMTHPKRLRKEPVHAAVVGMGIGVLAFWGETGDTIRFYEICPQVAQLAQDGRWFDYLSRSQARVEVVVDDARKALEAERSRGEGKWDLIVIDAYSGDAVPMHLIDEEAFLLYRDRLKDDGVIALHLSNQHMDLLPVAKAAAKLLRFDCFAYRGRGGFMALASEWALLSRKLPDTSDVGGRIELESIPDIGLPTDCCGSTLKYMLLNYFPGIFRTRGE